MGYSLFNTSLNSMGYPPAFGCQIHREGRRVLHGQPDRKDTRSRGRQNHECCGITNALSDRSSANSILFAPLCCLRALASTRVLDVGVKRFRSKTPSPAPVLAEAPGTTAPKNHPSLTRSLLLRTQAPRQAIPQLCGVNALSALKSYLRNDRIKAPAMTTPSLGCYRRLPSHPLACVPSADVSRPSGTVQCLKV